jgi:cob(I)alamin adenosyltransferase
MAGLIHIYCGDGKGKTTAAVGLAVRAAGAGKRVVFAQFFKDGSSSEINVLRSLPNVEVCVCTKRHGFFRNMGPEERERAAEDYSALFRLVREKAADADLVVLDELISLCNHSLLPEKEALEFMDGKPTALELVVTGRDPSDAMRERADYITEMKKLRHPFDRGVAARRGIEF